MSKASFPAYPQRQCIRPWLKRQVVTRCKVYSGVTEGIEGMREISSVL